MRKTVCCLINNMNMKTFAWKKCQKIFLEAVFSHLSKRFSKFPKIEEMYTETRSLVIQSKPPSCALWFISSVNLLCG